MLPFSEPTYSLPSTTEGEESTGLPLVEKFHKTFDVLGPATVVYPVWPESWRYMGQSSEAEPLSKTKTIDR